VALDSQPAALADRFGDDWGTGRLQHLGTSEPLPPGTSLLVVLGQARHRRCLVIGEPGSGKTTHLLQLAEDLIGDAKGSPGALVPVVLLLSRWTAAYPDLQSWVSAEVGERYDVARSEVDRWLASGSVILLLDGLDEVGSQRGDCLQALNAFVRDPVYSGVGLVLTCRTHDYETLPERLRFDIAVRVRPLSGEQVEHALVAAGPDLDALRHAVSKDAPLAELLTTPLMLGVAVLAYRGAPASTPVPTGKPERLRTLIYAEFVQRMLRRNRSLRPFEIASAEGLPFSTDETYVYLIWLAKMMRRQHQTVFYPDWLTPEWLPNRETRWPLRHRRGLVAWLAAKLGWDHTSTGIVGGRLAAIIGAMAAAPLGALAGGLSGAVLAAVICGTVLGAGVGITFGVLLQVPAINRLFVPLIGSADENPYAASGWTWSWHRALRALVVWLVFGIVVIGVPLGELAGWSTGIAAALVLASGGALSGGTVPDLTEPPASPGRALQASTVQLARLLAIMTAATILATVLAFSLKGPWTAIIASLPITIALMLTAGPGRAWLRSRAVNFGVHRARLLPRNLISFLQYADERIILQRTFGGFAFIHRTLRDYLADQSPAATRPRQR
jgi:NACHT domain